ncbi:hypothetical protein DPMN_106136 [Dreissena polymorpha]|uniref:Transposase n=1 Tax=Dreissena polymorpha TaxID=45954 RepID=A0A9D4K4F2_DREPO|nr:hypothetical protein DPMN_106136 [Dreissena polymorpha]
MDIHRELKEDGTTFSLSTTRRLTKAAGFTHSTHRYSQMVNTRNLQPRIDFCQTLIKSNDNIIFTDESSFQLHNNRTTSYRPEGSDRTSKTKTPVKSACVGRDKPERSHIYINFRRNHGQQVLH